MPSVIALIPARAGSKGVPNKNTRLLGGRPLIEWSIAACRMSVCIDRTIVSTDSQSYAASSIEKGAEAPFLRPSSISGDRSTDYEFIVHALDWLAARGEEPDYIVHMRPTTPFRDPALVDAAIGKFLDLKGFSSLRSVHEMPESAYKSFEIDARGVLKRLGAADTALDAANNARQTFPSTYQANGYVDVLSTSFIRSSRLIHGDSVYPFITSPVTEVDTEHDFSRLEFELSSRPDSYSRLFHRE